MQRAFRRHHLDRIKQRMVRMVRTWEHGSASFRQDVSADRIGRLASTHGSHQCMMCHFEKNFRSQRRRQALKASGSDPDTAGWNPAVAAKV